MSDILSIVKDRTLTYQQKIINLARAAENSVKVLPISKEVEEYRQQGIICDLMKECTYRPRYIVPDYDKFLREGMNS